MSSVFSIKSGKTLFKRRPVSYKNSISRSRHCTNQKSQKNDFNRTFCPPSTRSAGFRSPLTRKSWICAQKWSLRINTPSFISFKGWNRPFLRCRSWLNPWTWALTLNGLSSWAQKSSWAWCVTLPKKRKPFPRFFSTVFNSNESLNFDIYVLEWFLAEEKEKL